MLTFQKFTSVRCVNKHSFGQHDADMKNNPGDYNNLKVMHKILERELFWFLKIT